MFTKRHEQELAEIKALTHELDRRLKEVLEQLQAIQEGQARSTPGGAKKARRQAPTPAPPTDGAKPGKRRGARKRRDAELAGASEEE